MSTHTLDAVLTSVVAPAILIGLWWWCFGLYKWQTAWLDGSQDRREDTHAHDYHLALFRIAYNRGYQSIDRMRRKTEAQQQHAARVQRRLARRAARRNR